MKYCPKCGAQCQDDALYCSSCGEKLVVDVEAEVLEEPKEVKNNQTNNRRRDKDICEVAFIFCVIATVLGGFALIPLIWCIPLTASLHRRLKNNEPIGIALKVVILLFVSVIGGILLLIGDENDD